MKNQNRMIKKKKINEKKFIVDLCDLDSNEEKSAPTISDDLDWGYIVLNLFKNRINNIVYYNLKKSQEWQNVPFHVRKILSVACKYNNQKMHLMYLNMIEVKKNFELHRIPYAILKGFSLYERVYNEGDDFFRESNDIDFLVKKSDLNKVINVLHDMGYIQGRYNAFSKQIEKASREEVITMRMNTHQLFQFVKMDTYGCGMKPEIINIDINFSVFRGGHETDNVETEEILARREVIDSKYGSYYTLNTYDMFMQLIFHLYRENGYRELRNTMVDVTIMKFCDVKEFYTKMHMKDEKIIEYIKKYEIVDPAFYVMYFTKELFKCDIFDDILLKLNPSEKILAQCESERKLFWKRVFQ